jgi:guanylate kinase
VSGAGRVGISFVVAAPSGTGKTTVCRRVVEGGTGVVFSVSHTTRASRAGEVAGHDYHFATVDQFQRLVSEDGFLEWAVYNGNHSGTSLASIDTPLVAGQDVLLEIEVQGARQVRTRRSDARLIFLYPPAFDVLAQRLLGRGTDTAEQIRKRLDLAREEIAAMPEFDYAVENDDLDRCVADVEAIVEAERLGDTTSVRERFAVATARARFEGDF